MNVVEALHQIINSNEYIAYRKNNLDSDGVPEHIYMSVGFGNKRNILKTYSVKPSYEGVDVLQVYSGPSFDIADVMASDWAIIRKLELESRLAKRNV